MQGLKHPNIIECLEVIDTETHTYIVMEYIAGGDLFDYIMGKGVLEEPEAIGIFKQIISALEYLHEKNICHRDLKLENILIDDKGKIKIIDFGLSKKVEDQKKLDTFCGSWSYCSPEVAQQNDYDGYANDRWSLGILLFALVSGCLPFDDPDDNRCKTLHSIIH